MTSRKAWSSLPLAHPKVIEFEPRDTLNLPLGQTTVMFRTMSNCIVTDEEDQLPKRPTIALRSGSVTGDDEPIDGILNRFDRMLGKSLTLHFLNADLRGSGRAGSEPQEAADRLSQARAHGESSACQG
jgi:hypothetical protein